jgi:hypothetical protein
VTSVTFSPPHVYRHPGTRESVRLAGFEIRRTRSGQPDTWGMPARRRAVREELPDQQMDFIQLHVETPTGVFIRTIRPAAFLPDELDRGWAAETATRGAAAFWGLRDFVFRPALQRRGSASRELGDTIIVVGPRAASVQVKSRRAPSDDRRRERIWLDKKIAEGVRQSLGTIRALHRAATVELENERPEGDNDHLLDGLGSQVVG